MKQAVYFIGHMVVRIALSAPLRDLRSVQNGYAKLYAIGKQLLEKPENRFFTHNMEKGMTVLDIGAHSGYYSRIFSSLIGKNGTLYSFEPDPWCFGILKHQLRNKENCEVVPIALGTEKTTALFYPNARSRADSGLTPRPHSEKPIEVHMTSVDVFCRERGIQGVDAMKIDTEGSEMAVLLGASELLKTAPPKWICIEIFPEALKASGSSADTLCELLLQCSYVLNRISPSGSLCKITDIPAFLGECGHSYANVIATRKTENTD